MASPLCTAAGWGLGPWGLTPWGMGAFTGAGGGPIPSQAPFDVYCVGPCGEVSNLLTYTEVTAEGDGTQFPIDGPSGDQVLASGGTFDTGNASISISVPVPVNFTLDFTVLWKDLPPNFNDVIHSHSYFGAFTPGGGCVGLFFSRTGISYAGSVHVDGTNTLVLDTAVKYLPGSSVLVSENEYWTIRIAMSFSTGAVYIYVTPTAMLPSLGHQLRYVMPAIPSSTAALVPPSETLISVRGTVAAPTEVQIDSLCLGTGVIIPGIPPSADAGSDQAIRLCTILQLDGSGSFDPQGAPLTYQWRLIAAPTGSQYLVEGSDGRTFPLPSPTGFTNRFYSVALSTANSIAPIVAGDVLVVQGLVYTIVATGSDIDGFFVAVDGYVLPDSFSTPTAFSYLRQNGLNTPTSEKPTFYPDVQGLWKFDLTVFDGSLTSVEPAEVVINVTDTVVARGCTPDLTFVWNYLSDFWNQVEDGARISAFWQGLAQVAAAELLNLWQVDYSKSLRDIQRTFQRRWMHYDLLMQEDPTLLELSTVRAVFGGIESIDIPTAGLTGVFGSHLDLQLSTKTGSTIISFNQPDPYTAVQLQGLIAPALAQLDSAIVVRLFENTAGTAARIRIDAPYPITVLATSTAPFFSPGQVNGMPTGTAGAGVGLQVYRVERSLSLLNIKQNDFLCVDGVAYRIGGVVDDVSDPFPFQRLTLLDPLPLPVGSTWSIAGTVVSQDLDFWNGLCEQDDVVTFEVLTLASQQMQMVTATAVGASSALVHNLPVDATPVGAFLAQPAVYSVFLVSVLRRKYTALDPLVVDVPYLQETIASTDDTQVLRRNIDYYIDTFRGQPCLRFVTPVPANAGGNDVWQGTAPPGVLWAETTYLDNRPRIQNNFGIPADFTLDDLAQLPANVDYLSAVQGLWYAYFSGPTVSNIRAGVQILLGLPFAEVAGIIVEIRTDFSSSTGRILIQDAADSTVVRSYTYPVALTLDINPATGVAYIVGDAVAQFAPLTTGVEVEDYVKNPTWFQGYLEQGSFSEIEKYFKFLVRVSSAGFDLPAFLFGQSFVLRIKPTYTYPLFVTLLQLGQAGDTTVSVSDEIDLSGILNIYDGACFDNTLGVATMFDQPRPGGGGWRSQFDASPSVVPTYPVSTHPIVWGYDKKYLCPEDFILASLCTTFGAPALPTYDSIFQFDQPVYTTTMASFSSNLISLVPATTGVQIEGPVTMTSSGTLNSVTLEMVSPTPGVPNTYNLVIQKNGVDAATVAFTLTATGIGLTTAISVAVTNGDVLTCFIRSSTLGAVAVEWDTVLVETGVAVNWAFDTTLAAGSYCSYHVL